MQVDLQGQTALVTGGAMGIGRAIVDDLAANGAAVSSRTAASASSAAWCRYDFKARSWRPRPAW